MNIFNINVPKDSISMIFDDFNELENYNTTLYLHKSKITFDEDGNKYSAKLEIDLNQDSKKDKLVRQTLLKDYGSYIVTFLNADFSTPEKAYYSFFIYYGLEGFNSISKIKEKFPIEYKARYISTKNFLSYYKKAFSYAQDIYIKFQSDMRKTIDFVFNLHNITSDVNLDRYPKFVAFSEYIDLTHQFYTRISFRVLSIADEDVSKIKTLKQVEKLAHNIANKKSRK